MNSLVVGFHIVLWKPVSIGLSSGASGSSGTSGARRSSESGYRRIDPLLTRARLNGLVDGFHIVLWKPVSIRSAKWGKRVKWGKWGNAILRERIPSD